MSTYDDLIENDIAGQWDIDVRNSLRDWNPNVIVCPDCAGDAVFLESVWLTEGMVDFVHMNWHGYCSDGTVSEHPVDLYVCRDCDRTIVEG